MKGFIFYFTFFIEILCMKSIVFPPLVGFLKDG